MERSFFRVKKEHINEWKNEIVYLINLIPMEWLQMVSDVLQVAYITMNLYRFPTRERSR